MLLMMLDVDACILMDDHSPSKIQMVEADAMILNSQHALFPYRTKRVLSHGVNPLDTDSQYVILVYKGFFESFCQDLFGTSIAEIP
jgi:hypothetical protein